MILQTIKIPFEVQIMTNANEVTISRYYPINILKTYLINWVKRELHLRMTLAVLDSSSWLLLKSRPSSIFPSSWSTACFSSTFPTPFFFVSYDCKHKVHKLRGLYKNHSCMISYHTLYDNQRPVSKCCTITVESPYFMIGAPIISKSLSSRITFWSSFSCLRQNVVHDVVASSLQCNKSEIFHLKTVWF